MEHMKKSLLSVALIATLLAGPSIIFAQQANAAQQASKLGDLSSFVAIAGDTLLLVDKGDMKAAQVRITDFETAWDKAESRLYAKDKSTWSVIDDAADAAIGSLRENSPSEIKAQKTVSALIDALNHPVAE
jgi:hypothetical protein